LTWGAPKWPPTPSNARRAPSESWRFSVSVVAEHCRYNRRIAFCLAAIRPAIPEAVTP